MSYEERINHLKDEFSKTSHKLRMADATDLREWVESLEVAKRKADEYEAKAKAFDAISYIIKKRANNDFSSVNNDYEAGILRAYEVMECDVDDFYRGDTDA